MKINLKKVKNIDLCSENGHSQIIKQENLLGFYIQRKVKTKSVWKNKVTHSIKTFEIATNDMNHRFSSDTCQITINYNDGDFDHFFVRWDKNDYPYDFSSLQKSHKKENSIHFTSNCAPINLDS